MLSHDIEKLVKDQIEEFKLNKREQAELYQLLFDMGYPIKNDMGYMPEQDIEIEEGRNLAQNYRG